MENIKDIPQEKFTFVGDKNLSHDVKLETKPRSYLRDAFGRFCKNKGSVVAACIIIILVLFAIITPWCTQYKVSDEDVNFGFTKPKLHLFENTNFWDGCTEKTESYQNYVYYYAIGNELIGTASESSAHFVIKNQEYTITENNLYKYRLDSYHTTGTIYKQIDSKTYQLLQQYQNETNRQVLYPTLRLKDRPTTIQDSNNANYYYQTKMVSGKTVPVLDENGNVIPVYWTVVDGEQPDNYNSIRIEGENGFQQDGNTYFYVYGRPVSGGDYEVRINYYEYYIFYHSYVLKDGITEPYFPFGATDSGKDILTCLASGARFSFIFAISIALVNMFIGAIWGAVAGYYGGAIDLTMERITDILSAIPMMIVITLLKYHMKESSQTLIMFLAFIATGWIGMASTVRMQFYRFKNQEYVLASRTLGAKDFRVMFKHIFPNSLGTLVTSCALVIPSMIFSETSLSYLGIINLESGNITSVGTLIAAGQPFLTTYPHIVAFPSVFLALLMLSFNLFGNGLRDAFNPTLRGAEG